MSRRSFERYKQEMKDKVIQGAGSRRKSISMGDLRNKRNNEEWPVLNAADLQVTSNSSPAAEESPPPKPKSVDEGLAQLVLKKDDDIDQLVKSFVCDFKSLLTNTSTQDEVDSRSSRLNSDDSSTVIILFLGDFGDIGCLLVCVGNLS